MIYKQVPIVAHFSQFTDKPGYVEINFVEHNGGVSSGLFAITGTYADIFSGQRGRTFFMVIYMLCQDYQELYFLVYHIM